MIQVVRREGDVNNNQSNNPEDPGTEGEGCSLSIRNESGESLEDMVSIITLDEVSVIY